MKTDIQIYIVAGQLLNSLPTDHEGQYIEIDIELEFTNQVEECHGEHNICTWESSIQSIYVMKIELGSKQLVTDITDTMEGMFDDMIQKANLLI